MRANGFFNLEIGYIGWQWKIRGRWLVVEVFPTSWERPWYYHPIKSLGPAWKVGPLFVEWGG